MTLRGPAKQTLTVAVTVQDQQGTGTMKIENVSTITIIYNCVYQVHLKLHVNPRYTRPLKQN